MPGMYGDEQYLAHRLRHDRPEMGPLGGHHMMGFIENDPVRAACSRPHGLKIGKELTEELRPFCKRNSQQIDVQIDLRILKERQRLAHVDGMAFVSQCDDFL